MKTLEQYLISLVRGRDRQVTETAYYGELATVLNEVATPFKVEAKVHPKSDERNLPDVGIYDKNQAAGQKPAHGVVEVKGVDADIDVIATSEQVARYVKNYGQVLVTNYYQFMLITRQSDGTPRIEERYSLAGSAADFWKKAADPRAMIAEHATLLNEYLTRVLQRNAPLADPRDLARILASYARSARELIEHSNTDFAEFVALRADLHDGLGIHFEGTDGERFFRSTLVQTLFYGIFSAWIRWTETTAITSGRPFDIFRDSRRFSVPVLQELFYQFTNPDMTEPLNLEPLLEWTGDALNRVDRDAFFARFDQATAVQYFYEPFLAEFDPDLRRDLGVWYTPNEIVDYMVARVDQSLQTDLNIPLGLADPNVYVLDPCCGTGAYLAAVLRRIYARVLAERDVAAARDAVHDAITTRVFGFEILPAPFVVAHLSLGLLLASLGAPLERTKNERAGVYLTNALTGWGSTDNQPRQTFLRGLERERTAAEKVKQGGRILVVIGNPPYNAFAGTSPAEEQGLVEVYKQGLQSEWGIRKFNLDELYTRFLRLAERCITEMQTEHGGGRQGIICYVSSFSYVTDASFVVMRQRLLNEFDQIWIDSMNGDSRETGKRIPRGRGLLNEGAPDPSVFSTDFNREGIRLGTAVSLFVRQRQRADTPMIRYRDFWGVGKRRKLLESLNAPDFAADYTTSHPTAANRYAFRPYTVSANYSAWAALTDLCAVPPFNGPIERRGMALIDMQKSPLEHRISQYFDPKVNDEKIKLLHPKLMMTGNRIIGADARAKIWREHHYDVNKIVRYPFKPFDVRWCYLENLRPLFSEPSPELLDLRAIAGNTFFISRDTSDKDEEGVPFYYSARVCDYDLLSGHARHFPLYYFEKPKTPKTNGKRVSDEGEAQDPLLNVPVQTRVLANLSASSRTYLVGLGVNDVDSHAQSAALIWRHALAIGFAPAYRTEHADGLALGFPRIPLPATRDVLEASAALGKQIAALLDMETDAEGVDTGKFFDEVKNIADLRALDAKMPDLTITAGWGHFSANAVMPGRGKIEATDDGFLNIYLNDSTYWARVPVRTWAYTIGGYQVLKKWLSYRDKSVLKRAITNDESREFRRIVRRLTRLIALENELNTNYAAIAANSLLLDSQNAP